jgi:hypothetical protein
MTKLNQIIAIEKGVKNQFQEVENKAYHDLDKKQLFVGLSKTYQPDDEDATDAERLPSESVLVQIKAKDVLKTLTVALTRAIDVTATKDAANTRARADVKLEDGTVLAAGVPVTTLMALEKECEKLTAFVGRIPTLDPATTWTQADGGVYKSLPVQTKRTKKVPKAHILYPATTEHPAQVQAFTEDIYVGTWTKIEFSGAMSADEIADIQSRLDKLRTAIKFAREEANNIDVTDIHYGAYLLSYLFEGRNPVPF